MTEKIKDVQQESNLVNSAIFNLKTAIEQFSDNLDQIREFIDVLEPLLATKKNEQIKKDAKYIIPLMLAIADNEEVDLDIDDDFKEKLKLSTSKEIKIINDEKDGKKASKIVFKDTKTVKEFNLAVKNFKSTIENPKILYKSALISLISSVEWHFSNIFHYHYSKEPEVFPLKSEKKFSYSQLKDFNSINDAAQIIIEDHIEDIIRSGFKDWVKKLKEEVKIKAEYLNEDISDEISEFFFRRNIVVHNNGQVNSIYLNKASEKFTKGIKKGQIVSVGKDYLNRAIDILETYFVLFSADVWSKYERKEKEFDKYFYECLGNKIAFKHLEQGRYYIAETIFRNLAKCGYIFDESTILTAKINYWLAIKFQNNFDQVKKEIEEIDFSAKDILFIIAKHVLLDEFDEALKKLPVALKSSKLTVEYLESWPLFAEMRKNAKFLQLIEKSKDKVVKVVKLNPKNKPKSNKPAPIKPKPKKK